MPSYKQLHGGLDYEALAKSGIDINSVKDFSVCVNPYPLPREVKLAIKKADYSRYPDSKAGLLVSEIARHQDKNINQILAVNGISQGIFLLCQTLSSHYKKSIIIGPTYSEYEKGSKAAGMEIIRLNSSAKSNFCPDIEKLQKTIIQKPYSIIWICNPNNPTGTLLNKESTKLIHDACEKSGSILVVDQAYMNFVPQKERFSFSGNSLICLHSMTKDFSIPGLRLGYLTGSVRIINELKKIQPPWSLNSTAIAAGKAALENIQRYERQWEKIRKEKLNLSKRLTDLGYKVFPSSANFILVNDETHGGINPRHFRKILWKTKILVRDCDSFGLPGYLRIGVSTRKNNHALLKELSRESLWEK
ncbi:MAG: histidinol-phosphate transaminase [Spirochaetales bacterium]|nr:histidinol-phosphate transaminase [Spirochaetales bacterium]